MRPISRYDRFGGSYPDGQPEIGFVSSLDALPLMVAGGSVNAREDRSWLPVSCQGYASLARQMLGGKLQGGLIPFDLFATEMLDNPGQAARWQVIGVQTRCAWEFLVGLHAQKLLGKAQNGKKSGGFAEEFRIAMGGRHPIVRRRVDRWMRRCDVEQSMRVTYHVLPVKLMQRALEGGEMDALALPAPWGFAAQNSGLGMVESALEQNGWDLGMLLVLEQDVLTNRPELGESLGSAWRQAYEQMRALGNAETAQHLLSRNLFDSMDSLTMEKALGMTSPCQPMMFDVPVEHLSSRLTLLSEFGIWQGDPGSVTEIASALLQQMN